MGSITAERLYSKSPDKTASKDLTQRRLPATPLSPHAPQEAAAPYDAKAARRKEIGRRTPVRHGGQEDDTTRNRRQERTKCEKLKEFLTTPQLATFARQTFAAFWFGDDNSKKTNVVWFSNYSVFGVEPNTRRGPRRFSAPQWAGRPPFVRFRGGRPFSFTA